MEVHWRAWTILTIFFHLEAKHFDQNYDSDNSSKKGIVVDILWEDVAFAIISDLIVKPKFTNEKGTAWFMQDDIPFLKMY